MNRKTSAALKAGASVVVVIGLSVFSYFIVYGLPQKTMGSAPTHQISASSAVLVDEALGIKIYRHNGSNRLFIKNKSLCSVQIQCVWLYHGESTKWIEYLQPGAAREVGENSAQYGFYIRDDGGSRLLGWLSTYPR